MEIKPVPMAALPPKELRVPNSLKSQDGSADKVPAQVKKVAREFETMFIEMTMKAMRDTVGKDRLTGGGRGEETFRSMLDQEYARAGAAQGSLGLARQIERELTRRTTVPKGGDRAD